MPRIDWLSFFLGILAWYLFGFLMGALRSKG